MTNRQFKYCLIKQTHTVYSAPFYIFLHRDNPCSFTNTTG